MIKVLVRLVIIALVTLVTQVGGLTLFLCWLISRFLYPRAWSPKLRLAANVGAAAAIYAALHFYVVPPLAALGGRAPLPCFSEPDRPFAAGNPLICALDRHYVDARLIALLTNLSREVEREFPGTTTLFLDANMPFFPGFPLLPHLSHNDGRKLDIAYYYAAPDGRYEANTLRSPIGYWAFEQPNAAEASQCGNRPLSLRWNMSALQGLLPNRPLEPDRTRAALRWLVTEGQRFDLERIFIEPYLAKRLNVSSSLLGFQGCRAARHDDHIHIQVARQGAR